MKKRAHPRSGRGAGRAVTLSRALSKFGVASRTEAGRMILAGAVRVNGATILSPGMWVNPASDRITIGGKPLPRAPRVYYAMHKPPGVVTTRSDERGRGTVYDLLPEGLPWVFPVGRLDMETSGLLLFTNDTRFGERVTGPVGKVPKTYRVDLENPLSGRDAAAIRAGLVLPGGERCRPAEVTREKGDLRSCRIVITEGKNRQIRRMFESLGNPVTALQRLAVGRVFLGNLKEGEVRPLTPEEIRWLS